MEIRQFHLIGHYCEQSNHLWSWGVLARVLGGRAPFENFLRFQMAFYWLKMPRNCQNNIYSKLETFDFYLDLATLGISFQWKCKLPLLKNANKN